MLSEPQKCKSNVIFSYIKPTNNSACVSTPDVADDDTVIANVNCHLERPDCYSIMYSCYERECFEEDEPQEPHWRDEIIPCNGNCDESHKIETVMFGHTCGNGMIYIDSNFLDDCLSADYPCMIGKPL